MQFNCRPGTCSHPETYKEATNGSVISRCIWKERLLASVGGNPNINHGEVSVWQHTAAFSTAISKPPGHTCADTKLSTAACGPCWGSCGLAAWPRVCWSCLRRVSFYWETVLCGDNSKRHGAAFGIFSVKYAARLDLPLVNQTHCLLGENKTTLSTHC